MDEIIHVLLTTYVRTDCAVRTVDAVKRNLRWPDIQWWISDDGSPAGHVDQLVETINGPYTLYNSERKGVGHGMNTCLRAIFSQGTLVLVLEDDWELTNPFDPTPYVRLLEDHLDYGMVRLGYLSGNLSGITESVENRILWRLKHNGETYRFAGHPSLRHKRFHESYGYYPEDRSPGLTELAMCHNVNAISGPHIVYPAECGQWGIFGHIGAEHLGDIEPET